MTITSFFISFISVISDTKGRKPAFLFVAIISFIGSVMSIVKENLYLIVAGLSFQMLCKSSNFLGNNWYFSIMYTYMGEIMGEKLSIWTETTPIGNTDLIPGLGIY